MVELNVAYREQHYASSCTIRKNSLPGNHVFVYVYPSVCTFHFLNRWTIFHKKFKFSKILTFSGNCGFLGSLSACFIPTTNWTNFPTGISIWMNFFYMWKINSIRRLFLACNGYRTEIGISPKYFHEIPSFFPFKYSLKKETNFDEMQPEKTCFWRRIDGKYEFLLLLLTNMVLWVTTTVR